MRHKINHEWPDDVQPMPEDNTSEYVNAQVAAWRRLGVLIHPQVAMEIASWWHGMIGYPADFAQFSHTGTITGDLLTAIDREIPQYVGLLQSQFPAGLLSGRTCMTEFLENADALNALHALREYVVAALELAQNCGDCSEEYGPCDTHGETVVSREGASTRTADELQSMFIADAVDLGVKLSPWGRGTLTDYDNALEANRSERSGVAWLPEDDHGLADDMGTLTSHNGVFGLPGRRISDRPYYGWSARWVNAEDGARVIRALSALFIKSGERREVMFLEDLFEGQAIIVDGEIVYPGQGEE